MSSTAKAFVKSVSLAVRIDALRVELDALRREQLAALKATIALDIGPRIVFNARELFAHRLVSPALAEVLSQLNIRSPRQLGKRLRSLGLTRVGEDNAGVLWML